MGSRTASGEERRERSCGDDGGAGATRSGEEDGSERGYGDDELPNSLSEPETACTRMLLGG